MPPLVGVLLVGYVFLSLFGGWVIGSLISEGSSVRDRHRRQHEQALQQQLRELEQQIREEQLSDAERQRRQQSREHEAAITREARSIDAQHGVWRRSTSGRAWCGRWRGGSRGSRLGGAIVS